MPTYYIRLPEDAEKKALISNLVGTLEKLNGIVVFDAIGVVLPLGAPEAELMRSLARDVIPEKPSFGQLTGGGIVSRDEVLRIEREGDEVFIPAEGGMISSEALPLLGNLGEVTMIVPAGDGHCEECGAVFVKARKDSRYCSKACAQRAYQKKYQAEKLANNARAPRKARKAKGGFNDGSGVVNGKIAGFNANR